MQEESRKELSKFREELYKQFPSGHEYVQPIYDMEDLNDVIDVLYCAKKTKGHSWRVFTKKPTPQF